MTVRFVAPAEAELDEAIPYYEGESSGLGAEFLAEVVLAGSRIVGLPDEWQQLRDRLQQDVHLNTSGKASKKGTSESDEVADQGRFNFRAVAD